MGRVDEEVQRLETDVGDLPRQLETLEVERQEVQQRYRGTALDLEDHDPGFRRSISRTRRVVFGEVLPHPDPTRGDPLRVGGT